MNSTGAGADGGNEMKKKKDKTGASPARSRPLSWPLPAGLPRSFRAEIRNSTSSRSIAVTLEQADTPLLRLRGLMFRKRAVSILFTFACAGLHGIHSFFVSFPFDAVYLDGAGRVADVFERVPPFTPYLAPRRPVRYLIELPPGAAGRLHLKPNDFVNLYQCP